MSDVAARAGVSRQLVSMIIRGLPGPSAASRQLVLDTAAELDFRPNASARLLRQKRTRLIGMLVRTTNRFQLRVVDRMFERAADVGFGIVLGPVSEKRPTELVLSQLLEQRVEALACFNPDPSSPSLQRALASMPVVWMGERCDDLRADVVRTDDDTGLRLIVEHLTELGHQRIAYAGGLGGRVGPDRADAYRKAMNGAGLGRRIDIVEVGFDEADGASAARQLLDRAQLPTAVVCCSDHCASGARAAFALANVRVPADVSITGYDDSDVASLPFNQLTTVSQDVELTVDATIKAVLARLVDPAISRRDEPTTAFLVRRGSTAPPAPRRDGSATADNDSTKPMHF